MSEHAPNTHRDDAGFERQDLSPKTIYVFLIGLGVACVLVGFVLWGAYRILHVYNTKQQQPQNPLVTSSRPSDERNASFNAVHEEITKTIPQPRLEENERTELREFRLGEEQKLHSYGWVDQKAGVARIPIDRAMQLIAERGLPTTPRAGVAPSSPANTANEAAAKSDTSNLPQGTNPTAKGIKK